MSKPKIRRKEMLGVVIESSDGTVWAWKTKERQWSWCPGGQVRTATANGGERIAIWSKTIEGAVGYSVGYTDGYCCAEENALKL